MNRKEFETIAAQEFARVPVRFQEKIKNVALLVEGDGEFLGLYQGIPQTERGEGYGNLGTMPDTITLYYHPLLREAEELLADRIVETHEEAVRSAIRDTLWHEIGHYFGMDEPEVGVREGEGTNRF